jgi:hypothetical protein
MRLKNYMDEAVAKGYNYQLAMPAIKKLQSVKKNTTNDAAFLNKPDNGFWTSTLKGDNWSEWAEWSEAEDFSDISSGTVLEIQKGVSMYIIDNKSHMEKLLKKFPYESIGNTFIDFVKFSKVYDALYVTKQGALKNKGMSGLSAWDVESTVWFNTKKLKIIRNIDYTKEQEN